MRYNYLDTDTATICLDMNIPELRLLRKLVRTAAKAEGASYRLSAMADTLDTALQRTADRMRADASTLEAELKAEAEA